MNCGLLCGVFFRPRCVILAAVVLVAAAAIPIETRAEAPGLSAGQKERIDTAVEQFLAESRAPGLSLAIVTDHQVVLAQGYGVADVENNVPVTAQTVFRLASISKMITAVAVMQLAEQGKLDIHAPIQACVADFPEKQWPLTCAHLLAHQGGVRHYRDGETHSAVPYRRVRDSFHIFQDDPLLFEPGTRFSYTTYGYNVLGAAIEGAAETQYVEYVKASICEPAEMTTFRPDNAFEIIPHRASGYQLGRWDGRLRRSRMVDVSNKVPGGGWCSTPTDLARFAIALQQGKLVSQATLAEMWLPRPTADGAPTGMGYGCRVRDVAGRRHVAHSGGQPQVSTFLDMVPAQQFAVALMCNLEGAELPPLAERLAAIVLDPPQ